MTFQIFDSKEGSLLREETLDTDELGQAKFENSEQLIDLVPGNYIVAQDDINGKEISLVLANLNLTTVDFKGDLLKGRADPSGTVVVYAYDTLTEAEHVVEAVVDSEGKWKAQFDVNLHMEMELYARVFDMEGDETAIRWAPEPVCGDC